MWVGGWVGGWVDGWMGWWWFKADTNEWMDRWVNG